MAAWKHFFTWNYESWQEYRTYVQKNADINQGREEDCADLSMMLLIDFAALNGLPVTFEDNAGRRYISKAEGVLVPLYGVHYGLYRLDEDKTWSTPEEFYEMVKRRIGTEALWKRSTVVNPSGPMAGDLMMSWGSRPGGGSFRHHTALVYRVYKVAELHPKWQDKSVPDFPGDDKAKNQSSVLEYFRGTVDENGVTAYRHIDGRVHFDYLNHRGAAKPKAELIYYANALQLSDEGFEFRMYAANVLDNWTDWDGKGTPPKIMR